MLGPRAFAVRALFFDKTPGANWNLPWHQDVTIAVKERRDVAGFGPWTLKAGIHHVHAPGPLLARMVTIRIHLDDCGRRAGRCASCPARMPRAAWPLRRSPAGTRRHRRACRRPPQAGKISGSRDAGQSPRYSSVSASVNQRTSKGPGIGRIHLRRSSRSGLSGSLCRGDYVELLPLVLRLTGSADRAADLTQDTYAAFWGSLDHLPPRSRLQDLALRDRPEPLAEARAGSEGLRAGRPLAAWRTGSLRSDGPCWTGNSARPPDQALGHLPEDLREVFILRFWHELGYDEIGQIQGVTADLARWRYFAARKRLHQLLADWDPNERSKEGGSTCPMRSFLTMRGPSRPGWSGGSEASAQDAFPRAAGPLPGDHSLGP